MAHGRSMIRSLLVRAFLLGTMALLLEACATVSGGSIPPSAFEFHDIVPEQGPEAGGWKVAQVNILLSRISRRRPLQAWCDVEVGVPRITGKRPISTETAQRRSAESANGAARMVLLGNETVSAMACKQFRDEMRLLLREHIGGVRVTKFMTPGLEPKSFPDD
ncbi:hypothetical protein Q664_08390 [Archangium violaceum Cb vi76]|uniref:Uncharacterized protein n=2 Tax=Archangium violaceum TaxID=83451 RepID=A0A084SYR6_9BACT|nr:hypothetical protein Q664_08390 [Archangium violaceum Cb vi76]